MPPDLVTNGSDYANFNTLVNSCAAHPDPQDLRSVLLSSVGSSTSPNVREMHVDFLLEEEFNVSATFLEHFITAAHTEPGRSSFRAESVRRSVGDQFGEVDLIVLYKQPDGNGRHTAILIENKIGAEFQPNQAQRYRLRGKHGKGNEWRKVRKLECGLLGPR